MTNQVNATHISGNHFSVAVNGHTIDIDTDVEGGGTNKGPGPKIFMLLSLAGCTGMDIVPMLRKMRAPFSDLSIRVEGSLTEEDPRIYDKTKIIYTIKIAKDDEAKMAKAVKLSKTKYCGVSKMFESFSEVVFEIEYL